MAVAVSVLVVLAVATIITLTAWATVATSDASREAQAALYVVVAFITAGVFALVGRRTWTFLLQVLLSRLDAPAGTVATSLDVRVADRDQASALLYAAGFRFVESQPTRRPALKDYVTIVAWDTRPDRCGEEPMNPAVDALKAAGIRCRNVSALTIER